MKQENEKILQSWQDSLRSLAYPEKINDLQRFFKTAPGEYADGDIFIGLYVPDNRTVAREYANSPFEVIEAMLESPIHEFRLSGLLALVEAYKKCKEENRRAEIVNFYLSHARRCNNWDLVDLSAPYILGPELAQGRALKEQKLLASSDCLWKRRIALVATLHLVMKHLSTGLAIEQCHLHHTDSEQLMQKATGWVLREVGKKDMELLRDFLQNHISSMSAITLSYAIEKMEPDERRHWRNLRKLQTKKY